MEQAAQSILSQRVQAIKESPTLAVTARAAKLKSEGKDIIGLGAGEPDFDTPQHIKDAAKQAIDSGFTKYTPVAGIPGLKKAIVAKFKNQNNFDYTDKEVIVGVGGKQCIFNLALAVLNHGDEVIVPAPYWVSYADIALVAGAKPVIIECGIEQGFKLLPAQLEAAITPKTKLFMINSPSNPTGAVYTLEELKALGEVLKRHPHVLVATDDMYEHVNLTGEKFYNILNATPELKPRCIVLNGVSKAYSMTGWRIGYAGGPVALIKAMGTIQSQSTSNPCSVSQYAALEALTGPQDFLAPNRKLFERRRDLVVSMLNDAKGIKCPKPEGAFYVYPDISGCIGKTSAAGTKITNDEVFATALLEETGVAVVFGAAFGLSPNFRVSYATADEVLRDACARIQSFCASLT